MSQLSARQADGQSVSAGGLQFPVDGIVQTDRETVKVSLFGESFLVNSERLALFVVGEFFKRPDRAARFSQKDLHNFITTSVVNGQSEFATQALGFLLARPESSQAQGLKELIVSLGESRERSAAAVATFRRVLENAQEVFPPSVSLAAVLFYAGRDDIDWLRSRAVTIVYRCSSELRSFIEERFAAAATLEDNTRGEKITDFVLKLFGPQEPLFVRLRLVCNRILDLRRAAESGKPERIYQLLKTEPDNPLLATVVVPLAMGVLHDQARQALSGGQADRALQILGWISVELRTPLTHQLTLEALKAFQPLEISFLGDRQTAGFLKVLAANDAAVKAAYLTALELEISGMISQGRLEASERYLAQLLEIRPDPAAENDQIRARQAIAYMQASRRETVRGKLSEIRSGIGLGTRLQLLWHGYYIGVWQIVALVVAALLLAYLFVYKRRLEAQPLSTQNTAGESETCDNHRSIDEETDNDSPAGFGFSKFIHHMSPRRYEYDKCLAELGLQSGATLKDVKTAYRNLVKAVHPDLHAGAGTPESSKFVELTTTYNRVLELRKELDIKDEQAG